jgi:hypothetical protein
MVKEVRCRLKMTCTRAQLWMASTGDRIMIYNNGNRYDGYWLDVVFQGKGKYTWSNWDTYSGDFKLGRRHGRGTHTIVKTDQIGSVEWY